MAALVSVFVAAGCEQVLGIPDREEAANVECVDGACVCVSEAYADCNDDLADGCEVRLADDPTSCSACGHDCLGGGCAEGLCTPATVFADDGAFGLARVERTLFFGTAHGEVRSLDIDSGVLATLYESPTGVRKKVVDVAADAHHVVAISQFGMVVIDRASPAAPVTRPMVLSAFDRVALTDTHVIHMKRLADGQMGELWSYAFDGTSATLVASDMFFGSRPLTTHTSAPFWSTATTILTLDASGQPVIHQDGFTDIRGLAESDEALFVLDQLDDHCEIAVKPWDGSAGDSSSIGDKCPLQIAAYDRAAFWQDQTNRIVAFQEGIVVVATDLPPSAEVVLAPTEEAVYLTGDLGLRRVAR